MTLDDYLALPYVMDVTAVATSDGDWVCRLAYDEIPGCVVEAATPFEALERLEDLRRATIVHRLESGQGVPPARRTARGQR